MPARAYPRRLTAAVAALAVLLPTGSVAAPAAPAAAEAGDGYDVDHYNVRLKYVPRTERFRGRVWIRAHATQALERLTLDSRVAVSQVRVNGQPATFRQRHGALVVTPRSALRAGQAVTVKALYAGSARRWQPTADGVLALQPTRVHPVHLTPADKATYDVSVRVPRGVEVVSNGLFLGTRPSHRQRLWHWRTSDPMAPQRSFVAVGEYDLTRGRTDGHPVVVAVPSRQRRAGRAAAAAVARTPEVVAFAARQLGPYPFDATGGLVVDAPVVSAWGTQTRPVYSQDLWRTGSSLYPVVHGVARQWFGASVTGAGPGDAWLEEGLAAYVEWRWSEMQGQGSGRRLFETAWARYAGERSFWAVPMDRRAVLDRGAMTFHALRTRIGGPAFFSVLRRWSAEHRHANGSAADFIALAEAESREDLGSFFAAWLEADRPPATTRANGFPRGFTGRSTGAPASWAPISELHALLASTPPRPARG